MKSCWDHVNRFAHDVKILLGSTENLVFLAPKEAIFVFETLETLRPLETLETARDRLRPSRPAGMVRDAPGGFQSAEMLL